MEQTIKPYQYFYKREVDQLLNAYSSVNDPKTVQTVQALAAEKIRDILEHELPEIDTFLTTVLDVKLTKAQAERALEELKQIVQPFMQPSKPQIEKLFRKVKNSNNQLGMKSTCKNIRTSAGMIQVRRKIHGLLRR